jgi:cell division protein FtsA
MSNPSIRQLPEDMIFSLDIGTRNVVGAIGRKNDERYDVLDYEIVEHPERAMFDGQIHDIDMVVKVVNKIVAALEERSGYELTKVAIAAAGRALKTEKVRVSKNIDDTKEISKEETDALEMESIQSAQELLIAADKIATKYYCVGYSIMNYYLDDSMIINPRGHKGTTLEVELIATFLPHIVVDSLYTVMNKAGLEVQNLTLEPIAAINVTIPQNLRLLNLVLVDVGAGTSDIAVTKDGTIVAYGMVAKAGDAITEKLSKEFLLDFNEAERLKTSLSSSEEVHYTDILGMTYSKTSEEISNLLYATIEEIASDVAKVVLEVNEKPPSAVFCIGGGCQVPGFTQALSEQLSLQKERTVIKGAEMLEHVHYVGDPLNGPEFITPVGIGFTAFQEKEKDFLQIVVNDKPIRLFNSRQLNVSDALILVGYNARNLIASRGESIKIMVNGKSKQFFGEYGESAKIYVNGVVSSLDSKIKNKDVVYVEPAVAGETKDVKLYDIVTLPQKAYYNDKSFDLVRGLRVNDQPVSADVVLKNQDNVVFEQTQTIKDFSNLLGEELAAYKWYANGKVVAENYVIKNGDILSKEYIGMPATITADEMTDTSIQEMASALNDDTFSVEREPLAASSRERKEIAVTYDYEFTVNGQLLNIKGKDQPMVFVDIFDYIDFDLSVAKGIINLTLNGRRASYTETLKTGDNIEITWR